MEAQEEAERLHDDSTEEHFGMVRAVRHDDEVTIINNERSLDTIEVGDVDRLRRALYYYDKVVKL